jgi:hypothetical protein
MRNLELFTILTRHYHNFLDLILTINMTAVYDPSTILLCRRKPVESGVLKKPEIDPKRIEQVKQHLIATRMAPPNPLRRHHEHNASRKAHSKKSKLHANAGPRRLRHLEKEALKPRVDRKAKQHSSHGDFHTCEIDKRLLGRVLRQFRAKQLPVRERGDSKHEQVGSSKTTRITIRGRRCGCRHCRKSAAICLPSSPRRTKSMGAISSFPEAY